MPSDRHDNCPRKRRPKLIDGDHLISVIVIVIVGCDRVTEGVTEPSKNVSDSCQFSKL